MQFKVLHVPTNTYWWGELIENKNSKQIVELISKMCKTYSYYKNLGSVYLFETYVDGCRCLYPEDFKIVCSSKSKLDKKSRKIIERRHRDIHIMIKYGIRYHQVNLSLGLITRKEFQERKETPL